MTRGSDSQTSLQFLKSQQALEHRVEINIRQSQRAGSLQTKQRKEQTRVLTTNK